MNTRQETTMPTPTVLADSLEKLRIMRDDPPRETRVNQPETQLEGRALDVEALEHRLETAITMRLRAFGTEPLLRLYSEALDETRVAANLEAARVFALEVADDDSRLAVSAP
jgi:phosphomannomutase